MEKEKYKKIFKFIKEFNLVGDIFTFTNDKQILQDFFNAMTYLDDLYNNIYK